MVREGEGGGGEVQEAEGTHGTNGENSTRGGRRVSVTVKAVKRGEGEGGVNGYSGGGAGIAAVNTPVHKRRWNYRIGLRHASAAAPGPHNGNNGSNGEEGWGDDGGETKHVSGEAVRHSNPPVRHTPRRRAGNGTGNGGGGGDLSGGGSESESEEGEGGEEEGGSLGVSHKRKRMTYFSIREVHRRRYLMRSVGLELFDRSGEGARGHAIYIINMFTIR